MNFSGFSARLLGGATMAMLLAVGSASAATITIEQVVAWNGEITPASPFPLLNLGSAGPNSLTTSAGFTTGGVTVSFAGGSPASGEYAGNIANQTSSPFGSNNSTSNYLMAGGTTGSVTVTYANAGNALSLLWGTVDSTDSQNKLAITIDGVTITGGDILAAAASQGFGSFGSGTENVYLQITGLGPFTTATFTDSGNPSFEFVPGAVNSVPELSTWAMMIAGFAGIGFAAYRRRSQTTSFRFA
jgi:hypothetical protein